MQILSDLSYQANWIVTTYSLEEEVKDFGISIDGPRIRVWNKSEFQFKVDFAISIDGLNDELKTKSNFLVTTVKILR